MTVLDLVVPAERIPVAPAPAVGRSAGGGSGRVVGAVVGPVERAGAGATALAVAVAGLPLVMDPGGWFPYLSLRWAVLVGVAGLGLVASLRSSGRPTRWPVVVWCWIALVVVVVAASVAGPSWRTAFVGSIDRRFGAMTWMAHGALFVTALIAVRRRSDLVAVARGLVVGAIGVGVVTIAQQLGWAFPAQAVNRVRPGGPFGNADVLGVYCVLAVAAALGVALDGRERTGWRVAAMSAAASAVACSAASGARGGWIGLAVALTILGGAGIRSSSLSDRRRASVLAGLVAVGIAVLVGSGTWGRLLDLADGTATGRADTWTTAVEAIAERPLMGWGPDGLAEGLQHHVDADFERTYTRRQLPDRAHSAPLDVAGTVGLVGLAAWGAVLIATGRGVRRGVAADGSLLAVGLAAGLVGVLVAELTLFPTFDVDALAWLAAGALVGVGVADRGRTRRVGVAPVVTGMAAAVVVVALVVAARGVAADHQARRAADALSAGRPILASGAAGASLRDESAQPMPALLLAQAAIDEGRPSSMRQAIDDLDAVRRRSVDDGRLILAEGRLLDACGPQCADRRAGVQALGDELVARDPARSDGWRMEAALATDRGDPAEAVEDRRRVVDLGPTIARSWRELSTALRAAGDPADAVRAALRAVQLDPYDDANLAALGG